MKSSEFIKSIKNYTFSFSKWIFLSVIVGLIGGVIGSVFHISIDFVTEKRVENAWLLNLLPIGGIIIACLYRLFNKKGRIDTNRVIDSVRDGENVPLVMIPLIFISTVITHALGGSAGREGAALQLGGGIGYNVGKLFRLKKNSIKIIVMSGMSAVFSALFGTPLTAAIFSLEVTNVGIFHYAGLMPCVISAVTACQIAKAFGLGGVHFGGVEFGGLTVDIVFKVAILSVLCAIISILFCISVKKCEYAFDKLIKNCYLRAFVGGLIIVIMTYIVGSYDYNGAGMDVIERAINGEADSFAFIIKILFTAITISAGFKGGEIVPTFFIGSTFGCVIAPLLGLDASMSAAIGFIAMFCGVVNCPVASIILATEVFGIEGMLLFAVAVSISYMMSGCFGLYHSQKILYSKTDDEFIDANAI